MGDWKFLGVTLKKVYYLKGIIVWTLLSTFIAGVFTHYYQGRHTTIIVIGIFLIGWFFTVIWMTIKSNPELTKTPEKPRPKFDNPIAESLYDALKDMSEKPTKDSKRQNLREDAQ